MAALEGWGTSTYEEDKVRSLEDKVNATLLERAGKREVHFQQFIEGGGYWMVMGDPKLGDAYPDYKVGEKADRTHHCTCQDHTGGKYRKICSHILAVILWKRENDYKPVTRQPDRAEVQRDHNTAVGIPQPPEEEAEAAPRSLAVPSHASSSIPTDPQDPRWGVVELPEWIEKLRDHQVDAVEDVVSAFDRGAKVVFLDAPTGSGKTLIAELVRRLVNGGGRTIYTCSTKTLQDQFLRDYRYAKVVKGRSNYPTELGDPDITCDDCTGNTPDDCRWCEKECPYILARERAASSDLAVLNTSYALTIWNRTKMFQDYPLVVVDECDLLEGSVMGYAEVRVTEGMMIRHQLNYPEKITVRESWVEWADETWPILDEAAGRVRGDDVRALRERKRLRRLRDEVRDLAVSLTNEDVTWVYTPEGGHVVFKPVMVDHLGEGTLWDKGRRWLVMSASIISAQEMAESLGFEDEWELVTVPSTFPITNRQIHVCNVGSMASSKDAEGRKKQEVTLPRMCEAIVKVVEAHPGERVLVHAHSYKLAKILAAYLTTHLDRRIVTYTNGRGREAALREYLDEEGAVMVAPSMDRGVDLPDDACRVQVIAKVPFPFLGDKQVQSRLYGTRNGRLWYAVQAVRTLVQMTGRAVRSAEDWATTYILDGDFVRLWKKNERLFPEWWREALVWDGKKKMELGL